MKILNGFAAKFYPFIVALKLSLEEDNLTKNNNLKMVEIMVRHSLMLTCKKAFHKSTWIAAEYQLY